MTAHLNESTVQRPMSPLPNGLFATFTDWTLDVRLLYCFHATKSEYRHGHRRNGANELRPEPAGKPEEGHLSYR